jgi:hypothetical protein
MNITCTGNTIAVSAILTIVAWLGCVSADAAELIPTAEETREFEIFVDGTSSGTSTISIREYPEGRMVASTVAKVKVPTLVYTYVYQFDGAEEWNSDRFLNIQSRTVDGLSKFALRADADKTGTSVRVKDGKPSRSGLVAMTTNYWRLPAKDFEQGSVAVLDAGTGKTYRIQLQRVGTEEYSFRGKTLTCQHYKGTGEQEVDLWFDGTGRLVRQSGIEDGYKTELRLSGYKRTPGK